MDKLRLATVEETQKIQQGSDLTPSSTVVALENSQTGEPDFAVLRQAFEMDPVLYAPSTNMRRKMLFAWAIENGLRMIGAVPGYYFQVSADESAEEWRSTLLNYGAKQISATPEYRYFKPL